MKNVWAAFVLLIVAETEIVLLTKFVINNFVTADVELIVIVHLVNHA